MNIRAATVGDLERCARLSGSYLTDYVWQVEGVAGPEQVNLAFRRVRAPRSVPVRYPRSTEGLLADLQRNECLLVADEMGLVQGFVDMTISRWQWNGWIEHLVVDPPFRGQGVGTRLLRAAERWARGSDLRAILIAVQPRNDPAIALVSGLGWKWAGCVERYFSNGDMAMLYTLVL